MEKPSVEDVNILMAWKKCYLSWTGALLTSSRWIVPFVGSGLQKKYALTHALTRFLRVAYNQIVREGYCAFVGTVMNVGMQSIAAGNGSSMPFVPL